MPFLTPTQVEMTYTDWYNQRVESSPMVLSGEPVFKGTRLAVRRIGGLILRFREEILPEIRRDYPNVTPTDMLHAVYFTRENPRTYR